MPVGGGVATFDCNGDGFPDMLLSGGENKAKFYRNQSTRGGALKVRLREQSGLRSSIASPAPMPSTSTATASWTCACCGLAKLLPCIWLGDCKFERANEKWGFNGGDAWWTAFSATWEHGKYAWPTLALGSYVDCNQEIDPWGSCNGQLAAAPLLGATGFGRHRRC